MSGSINKVILVGNLGKDPEIRATQDGREIGTLSIATSESWKDKQTGERREKVEWHRVVIFNENLVKIAKQYLHKGSKVYIEGQLTTRKWTDKNGVDCYTTEIVVQGYHGTLTGLDKAPARDGGEYGYSAPAAAPRVAASQAAAPLDDEIPFAWLIAVGLTGMMLLQIGGAA
jgi:single-strand DNA-binding protein